MNRWTRALRENRKYSVFWGVFVVVTFLLIFDRLGGSEYKDIVIFVTGLYMAGNVGEHLSKRGQANPP